MKLRLTCLSLATAVLATGCSAWNEYSTYNPDHSAGDYKVAWTHPSNLPAAQPMMIEEEEIMIMEEQPSGDTVIFEEETIKLYDGQAY